ncbi:MAG: TonB-dependent receptor, partial [Opitutaceae bacterium]|nr:TonB-dependent receptor [Opitutaceae bacterium]
TNMATLRWSGPVWSLPGGPLTLSGAAERRKEGTIGSYNGTNSVVPEARSHSYSIGQSQSITAVYSELTMPLFGGRRKLPGVHRLELQAAVRKEWFGVKTTRLAASNSLSYQLLSGGVPNAVPFATTHGLAKYDSTNPTFGFVYNPIPDVMLRASTASAFGAPTYSQLLPGLPSTRTTTVLDPRRSNASTATMTIGGGNPDIDPESSQSQSAGIVITPRFLKQLRLAVDYTQIEKDNNIGSLGAQAIVNNERYFPTRVTRGTPLATDPSGVGPITLVNTTALNLYKTKVETYDVTADYRWDSAQRGSVTLGALATWQPHYQQQLTLDAPLVEYSNYSSANYPLHFRGNASLTWEHRRWVAGWTSLYYGSYRIYGPPIVAATTNVLNNGGPTVGSQITHDLFVSYRVPSASRGSSWYERALDGVDVQLGVKNVFNTQPAFDGSAPGTFYASPWVSMRMAEYTVSLKKRY